MSTVKIATLFDTNDLQSKAKLKKSIGTMWRRYGRGEKPCSTCKHLSKNQAGYWKCLLYSNSTSPTTDWSKSWMGCKEHSDT